MVFVVNKKEGNTFIIYISIDKNSLPYKKIYFVEVNKQLEILQKKT